MISTVAGGVGGPARATTVALGNTPEGLGSFSLCGVSFAAGHLYIADGAAVRTVNPSTDLLSTPVGTGVAGPGGDGGAATRASVNTCGVTVDPAGNLVIADTGNNRIRVVAAGTGTFYGKAMTAGDIYTIAGNGRHGFSGDGPATRNELNEPAVVAVDAGNLLIADTFSSRIRMVAG